jgi:transaldolase
MQINVTAIFNKEEIDSLKDCFGMETNVIISIFGGRINDYGLDCSDIIKHAVETFKEYKNIKILWAACRSVYNIIEAKKQGAHIITVPESVLSKIHRLNQNPDDGTLETVSLFRKDGINGKICFTDDDDDELKVG